MSNKGPQPVKKKRKKKGSHWGVDQQKVHPWDIDIDSGDEPKVASAVAMPKPRRENAPTVREMRRKSQS